MTKKETVSVKIEQENKLFKPAIVQNIYNKVAEEYDNHSAITEEIAKRLADRLLDNKYKFKHILDLGAGTGILEKIITSNQQPNLFVSADFSHNMLKQAGSNKVILNAEENLPFANKTFDLVISNLMLPWINDIAKCLHMAGKVLKEDGLLLTSTIGSESFNEFSYAFAEAGLGTNHIIPLPDVQSVGSVLQRRGFALPVVDRDIITLSYPNFKAIYSDIKNLGAKNLNPNRQKGLMSKRALNKMEKIYADNFTLADGSLKLTLEVIYLHGLRPHFSQQQPLKPGSAKISLSEIL